MPSAPSPLESLPLTEVLENVNVPSYLIDATGVIRWLNRAAENIVGDLRARQFTSAVAPEDSRRARELFARKILGTTEVTDSGVVVAGADGTRVAVEISSVPIRHGDHVVGVFGQVADVIEEPHAHPDLQLTPRQAEVLTLLERGALDERDRRRTPYQRRDRPQSHQALAPGRRSPLSPGSSCDR